MRKIMFMIPTLMGGGAEKVLINLINSLDTKKYDITVFSLIDKGINKKFLKKEISYKYAFKYNIKGIRHILKLFNCRFLFKHFIKERYDTIISFLEGPTTRIVSGCNYDSNLIAWVHTENKKAYSIAFRNKKEMQKCYRKFNKIVCVSNDVLTSFNEYTNNFFESKTLILKNINNPYEIIEKSWQDIDYKKDKFRIITIGRLDENKDHKRLIPIIYKLSQKYNIELFILGEGKERKNIELEIEKYKLKNVFMLGYQENPYKYLAKSDLYICCSHYEGYSTTTIEALILNIPILATNCSGMKEILNNGKYGIIVEDEDNCIYEKLEEIINNSKILKDLIQMQKEGINYIKKEFKYDIEEIENVINGEK